MMHITYGKPLKVIEVIEMTWKRENSGAEGQHYLKISKKY